MHTAAGQAQSSGPGRSGVSKLDQWLTDNAGDMGGRILLVVWKDGKLVYNHSVNMSMRQKMMN